MNASSQGERLLSPVSCYIARAHDDFGTGACRIYRSGPVNPAEQNVFRCYSGTTFELVAPGILDDDIYNAYLEVVARYIVPGKPPPSTKGAPLPTCKVHCRYNQFV